DGAWGRPAPGRRRRSRGPSARGRQGGGGPLGDPDARAPGDATELDRDRGRLADPAPEAGAAMLAPPPRERPERGDLLDAAAALDPGAEAEPHDPSRLGLEPGIGTEPDRQGGGVDHEAPHVLGRRFDRLLVDLGSHRTSLIDLQPHGCRSSTGAIRSATVRLPSYPGGGEGCRRAGSPP